MKVLVFGAGAWGTALAISAATRHDVTLWARDAAQADAMRAAAENARYLPGARLPEALRVAGGDASAMADLAASQDLVIIATPMSGLRASLHALRGCVAPVAWLCKGFEAPTSDAPDAIGLLGHQVARQAAPELRVGALSGPSFAQEVAAGQPTALVAASAHAEVRERLVQVFHSPTLRVYANDDLVGVEVGGAVKNVLSIATGLCDGLGEHGLGLNARAALITRGLAEMTRLGLALGAKLETMMGLSGLGDLVLTATGSLSRNRRVGLLLAQGQTLEQAVTSLGHVAEGVYCARTVASCAARLSVDMPITQGVVAVLDGRLKAADAVAQLMRRDPVAEGH